MEDLQEKLQEYIANRKISKKILELEQDKLDKHLSHLKDLEEARGIFQAAAKATQMQLSSQVETIVSSALEAVNFSYKFVMKFESRRNTLECDLKFEINGKLRSPLNSCGFGAASIASLALRVAYWKLGDSNNTIILDEPLSCLDKDRQPIASMLIHQLSRMRRGLQFIIITHSPALAESADRVFRVTKDGDISHVNEIENNS